jgi:hypothetical protein
MNQEIAPIRPKPPVNDPYERGRTRSIQAAVKQWLESSPNSVLNQVDAPRQSVNLVEFLEQQNVGPSRPVKEANRLSVTSLEESHNEPFFDVGGYLSPARVSVDQSAALASASLFGGPAPAENSNAEVTDVNRAEEIGSAALPPLQVLSIFG